MSNNFKDNIILYACVLTGIAILALAARTIAIGVGVDDFIATCTFWLAMLLGVSFYLIFERAFEKGVNIVIDKYFKPTESTREQLLQSCEEQFEEEEEVAEEIEQPIEPEIEIEEEQPVKIIEIVEEVRTNITVDVESIRNQHINSVIEQKQQKLQIALDYTQRIFAPHISNKDLELLLQNIELYADGIIDLAHPINTGDLSNNDLYHFGWNIHNHFKCMKQIKTAEFLQSIFSYALRDVESTDTIRKKLRNDEGKVIKLQSNLSPEE